MHRHTHTPAGCRDDLGQMEYFGCSSAVMPCQATARRIHTHTHGRCRHITVVCIFGEQNLVLLLLKEAQMAQ